VRLIQFRNRNVPYALFGICGITGSVPEKVW
jgi:hypothetical protein